MIKAVILIGGPQKGTRFRPLSFDVPKPLFPVAGYPIIYHHIDALSKVSFLFFYFDLRFLFYQIIQYNKLLFKIEEVKEIYLMGFFQPLEDLNRFVLNAQNEFKIPIRFVKYNFNQY